MRKNLLAGIIAFLITTAAPAQMNFSGILDSSVSVQAGTPASDLSLGIEEYANIRFQSRLRESGTFYGAVNLIAGSGNYAPAIAAMGAYPFGGNFISAIELERLYVRLNFENTDLDGGLFRLPFGYGQVWGPSDFLNPRNPLKPDARPRAILGAGLSWYPMDELKLLGFTASPRNLFLQDAQGWLFGVSADRHWEKISVQGLYSFETPKITSGNGVHRIGVSVKADMEAGLVMDALYTYNPEAKTELDGLSFSIGGDYSLFDGNMIVIAEYLYNGDTSSTALGYGGSFTNNHYLYTGVTWRFNDFTNLSAALISCLDGVSFTPIFTLNHDLFQGVALTVSAQMPFDRDLFHGIYCTVRLRIRF